MRLASSSGVVIASPLCLTAEATIYQPLVLVRILLVFRRGASGRYQNRRSACTNRVRRRRVPASAFRLGVACVGLGWSLCFGPFDYVREGVVGIA